MAKESTVWHTHSSYLCKSKKLWSSTILVKASTTKMKLRPRKITPYGE